ncbi:MAG TPA: hypothetical protein VGE76_21760, partial [Opitutaceae bacterium]
VFFDNSPSFTIGSGSTVKKVAWFDSKAPLRSGWAWGQSVLKDRAAIITAPVGAGKLHLMGSEVAFRAQTQGTFKLLFNALQLATAEDAAKR